MDGLRLVELLERFANERAATPWLEVESWPNCKRSLPSLRFFGRCAQSAERQADAAPALRRVQEVLQPLYRYVIERSPIPLHKWLICAFLMIRSKGVSSLQLAHELGITKDSTWFIAHRLRSGMRIECGMFSGTAEVDEIYSEGKNNNRH